MSFHSFPEVTWAAMETAHATFFDIANRDKLVLIGSHDGSHLAPRVAGSPGTLLVSLFAFVMKIDDLFHSSVLLLQVFNNLLWIQPIRLRLVLFLFFGQFFTELHLYPFFFFFFVKACLLCVDLDAILNELFFVFQK